MCSLQKLRSTFVKSTFTAIWQPLRCWNRVIRTHLQTYLFPQQQEMKQECQGEMRGAKGSRRGQRGALRTAQGHLWRGAGVRRVARNQHAHTCHLIQSDTDTQGPAPAASRKPIRSDLTGLSAFHGCCFTQNLHPAEFEETLSVRFCSLHVLVNKKKTSNDNWSVPLILDLKKSHPIVWRSAAVPSPCHFVPAQRRRV